MEKIGRKSNNLLAFVLTLFAVCAILPSYLEAQIYDGTTLKIASVSDIVSKLKPGSILILGEMHGLPPVQAQQVEILNALRLVNTGKISVGMEFFNYTDQDFLNKYKSKELEETEFLKQVNWKGYPFALYKAQTLFPEFPKAEETRGLNLTRAVTSQIAKGGLDSLSPDQKMLLPPQFTLGRESYRERFFNAMGVHPSPQYENYFVAQCAWDDTMAWQAVDFLKNNPDHIFVIIVGEFHSQFGGGLQDRISARMEIEKIKIPMISFSQIYTEGMTDEEIQNELQPSPTEGPRADFIGLSSASVEKISDLDSSLKIGLFNLSEQKAKNKKSITAEKQLRSLFLAL